MNPLQEEPVISSGAIAGAVSAVLVMLVALGVLDLTPDQQAAILAALVAVLPIAMALWARTKSTPLVKPVDIDGKGLVRPSGSISLAAQGALMSEAEKQMAEDGLVRKG